MTHLRKMMLEELGVARPFEHEDPGEALLGLRAPGAVRGRAELGARIGRAFLAVCDQSGTRKKQTC